MTAEDGAKFKRVLPSTGEEKELVFGQTGDGEGRINMVFAVNPDAPVISATLESADGTKSTDYALDFSKCNFR